MKNKGFLNTFIIVLASTLVFYGFSTVGALAVNTAVLTSNDFGDQTYVGPFTISGQKEKAAKDQLTSDLSELQSNLMVDLIYQDASVELPLEIIHYDVVKTIELAKSGEENPIIVSVSVDGLRTVLTQQFSPLLFSEEDVVSIAKGIEQELAMGITPIEVSITDYMAMSHVNNVEIAKSATTLANGSSSIMQTIQGLNGFEITPMMTFSLLDVVKEENIELLSDDELSVLASALYTTLLQTNFKIIERNIGISLTKDIQPGYEAAINQERKLDFIFMNPNKTQFTLETRLQNGKIHIGLIGLPLLYSYEPYTDKYETFQPKTIRKFSAFVEKGQVRVDNKGFEGMGIEMHRLITSDGDILADEWLSSDFYIPLPKIETHPLINEPGESNTSDSGITNPDTNQNQNDSVLDNADVIDDSEENTAVLDEDVQYDKGGNIID